MPRRRPFEGATLAADAQLLGLSMEQAARRLDAAPRPPPLPHGSARAAAPTPPPVPPEVTALREPLAQALVGRIGPVGDLVFAEAFAAWCEAAPPRSAGLARLLDLLAREVDDDAEREAFLAEARRLVG